MGHISSSGATVKTNLRINNTGRGKVTLNDRLSKYSSDRFKSYPVGNIFPAGKYKIL